jgi:hypothetical protein
VKKSKIHRKDAKVQRNRKVKTLFEKALFASPLLFCASAVGVKAFFHKLSGHGAREGSRTPTPCSAGT